VFKLPSFRKSGDAKVGVMSTLAIDTYRLHKRLRDAGFDDLQAAAQVEVVTEALREREEQTGAVTRQDFKELEYKIELLRADSKRDLAETKAELVRWIIGAGFLQTVLIAGLLLKLVGK